MSAQCTSSSTSTIGAATDISPRRSTTLSNRRWRSASGSPWSGSASPGTRAARSGTMRVSSPPSGPTSARRRSGSTTRDVLAQRLGERLVRDAELLVAAPPQHGGAAVVRDAAQLGDEARLADARLARHEHDAPRALGALLPERGDALELGGAARERERRGDVEERRQRHRALGRAALPDRLAHDERLGETLELARAERLELHLVARTRRARARGRSRGSGRPSPTRTAATPRRPACRTSRRPRRPRRRRSRRRASRAVPSVRRRLWRSTARCIATAPASASDAPANDAIERVADGLDLGAAGRRERLAESREVVAAQGVGRRVAVLVGELGRPDEVGEEDGDELGPAARPLAVPRRHGRHPRRSRRRPPPGYGCVSRPRISR